MAEEPQTERYGIGREEIRRRNFIRPQQLPYKNGVGMVIDSGSFRETMEKALHIADWSGFEARCREARRRRKLRGIGLNPVRNPSNELGVKGIGEGGACDALGVAHIDMPLTPETLWRALEENRLHAAAE